jgi:hypothetical protein
MTAPRTVPFFSQDFQTVDKTNLSLQDGQYRSEWHDILERTVYSGMDMPSLIPRAKVLSNIAWLISPKIDMDTHTNEILTFRTAQHHLDVDSPLNSSIYLVF